MIVVAVLLLDIAIQGASVLNQTRLFAIEPEARSRMNTAFVACNFMGGALGSLAAGILWNGGGWQRLMGGAMTLVALALLVWLLGFKSLHGVEASASRRSS